MNTYARVEALAWERFGQRSEAVGASFRRFALVGGTALNRGANASSASARDDLGWGRELFSLLWPSRRGLTFDDDVDR